MSFLQKLIRDLEAPVAVRKAGSGWYSGFFGLLLGLAGLGMVIALRWPGLFAMPELEVVRQFGGFRVIVHVTLITAYALALLSLLLRPRPALGLSALVVVLGAILLGGSRVEASDTANWGIFFGLDFFVVNLLAAGLMFAPIERLFPHKREQRLFRPEWREDLFYYLISSMLVQVITFLSLAPSNLINTATSDFDHIRAAIASQPAILQFIEIILLRGVTLLPLLTMGFSPAVMQAYIAFIYVYSALVHANLRGDFNILGKFLVTPRFHHWHHGLEQEAVDKNFAIHFPFLDKLFGTYHFPDSRWPEGYGVPEKVPQGYWKQQLYPFRRKRMVDQENRSDVKPAG
jgi:sterol desaturase/sphingolipid hydroxylase (fatty acid hydroxylase superfamily)